MIARRPFRWMRWLVPAAAAGTAVTVENMTGFKPPHWSYWISVALFTLFGVVALTNPRGDQEMRPAFVRTMGVAFLALALLGALYLSGFAGTFGSVQR